VLSVIVIVCDAIPELAESAGATATLYVTSDTADCVYPIGASMAFNVTFDDTVNGPEYRVEFVVGVLPSFVK
jgi:hypothetical protein